MQDEEELRDIKKGASLRFVKTFTYSETLGPGDIQVRRLLVLAASRNSITFSVRPPSSKGWDELAGSPAQAGSGISKSYAQALGRQSRH